MISQISNNAVNFSPSSSGQPAPVVELKAQKPAAPVELPQQAVQAVEKPDAATAKLAAEQINKLVQQFDRNLQFTVDEDTNIKVVKVIDTQSKDVIRQMPTEEMLAMDRPEAVTDDPQLRAYRCLLENARAMLRAAREERWDDLAALDAERQDCFRQVTQQDLISTRPEAVEGKAALIQSILDCDEQTRTLAHTWQAEMAEVLGSMDNERKLSDAYGGV